MKRPFGIALIAYFYIFGAIILLLTLGIKQDIGINVRFGVPYLPEIAVRIFIALFSIIVILYTFMKRRNFYENVKYSSEKTNQGN